MKTIVTFLIALLAFASTLAWAGPEQNPGGAGSAPVQSQSQARELAKPAAGTAHHGASPRSAVKPAARSAASPVANLGFELPTGPAVICACVVDKTLG